MYARSSSGLERLASVFTALLLAMGLFAVPAAAQDATNMDPDGTLHASIVVEGVEYTPAEIAAWVDAYRADPASLPASLPETVRAAVYSIAAQTGGN
jgi:hypothetical protein